MDFIVKLAVIQFVLLIVTTEGKIAFIEMDEYDINNLDSHYTKFYLWVYRTLRKIYLPQSLLFVGSVLLAVVIGIIKS